MNLFENMGNVNRGEEVKPLIAKWSKTGLKKHQKPPSKSCNTNRCF